MKTIIVYYSFTENNEKLANYLHKKLDCDLARLETVGRRNGFSVFLDIAFNRKPSVKPLSRDVKNYDHVIFLSPVWGGRIASPLRSFLIKEKSSLGRFSFITVCGGGDQKQKDNLRTELTALVGHEPQQVVELWVSKLITHDKNAKIVSAFRINDEDFDKFQHELADILEAHSSLAALP